MKFECVCLLIIFLCVVDNWAYNTEVCDDLPCKTGPCKASFQMWRFIKARNMCEDFTYGGCLATRNLFETEDECRKTCLK